MGAQSSSNTTKSYNKILESPRNLPNKSASMKKIFNNDNKKDPLLAVETTPNDKTSLISSKRKFFLSSWNNPTFVLLPEALDHLSSVRRLTSVRNSCNNDDSIDLISK